ncbi:hypothetical protein [Cupriavidus nantongensis]|uniref:Uncharacterized protein n=1 Tax=Cupriavidus nantongensis TaxID=1796606 RepID=A0A142JIT0_9BURK|nr:hypothetical protein [Cupriavidus nantongensis]AMR77992.1 hypothetical protein A2G96_09700 [Cupriavidus nantongensis]
MNVHLLNQISLGCAVLSFVLSFAALAREKWYVRAAMWLAIFATASCVLASSYATWCGLTCLDGSWFEDGDKAKRYVTMALLVITFGVVWMFGKPTTEASPS